MDRFLARWRPAPQFCLALAVGALLFNIALPGELAGHLQVASWLRKSVTKVLNSGTAWAATAVVTGWVARRVVAGAVAGVVAAEGSLLVHYVLGIVLGIYPPGALTSNGIWFVAGVVACAPLGVVGALASRPGRLGLAARLVVPLGALAEPFARGLFHPSARLPWSNRWSDVTSGAVLLALGAAGVLVVLWCGPRRLCASRRDYSGTTSSAGSASSQSGTSAGSSGTSTALGSAVPKRRSRSA